MSFHCIIPTHLRYAVLNIVCDSTIHDITRAEHCERQPFNEIVRYICCVNILEPLAFKIMGHSFGSLDETCAHQWNMCCRKLYTIEINRVSMKSTSKLKILVLYFYFCFITWVPPIFVSIEISEKMKFLMSWTGNSYFRALV